RAGSVGVPGGGLYYSVLSSRHLPRPRPPARGPAPPPLLAPQLGRELARAAPPARVVWLSCSNAVNQGPDAKALAAALGGVPTVVAVEPFWTETARRATVVLPPALWLEEEDLVGSSWHNTVAAARPVLDAPGGCRTDFEIAAEVARRMGFEHPFRAVDDWLGACLAPGLTLAEVRARGWARVPWPRVAWAEGSAHPDGRFRLLPALTPEPPIDPRYPLRLLTLIRRDALHSQLLPEAEPGPLPVRLHPATAAPLGLGPGSPVRVVSRVGELEGEVHLDPGLHPGAVACPRGGWASLGQGVNEATEDAVTDLGGSAAYYATGVRLERVAGPPTLT
ncbi:MAG: molybdopterin dinucleotide binding domain-containing protein, partial [Deferrisomatales bacterium]